MMRRPFTTVKKDRKEQKDMTTKSLCSQEETDPDFDEVLDALTALLSFLPENTKKVINYDRYEVMMQTAAELKEILAQSTEKGEFEINISEMFRMGFIKCTLDDLTVTDVAAFAGMIKKADNFEIYPRTDGKLQLNITFQSVMKYVGKEQQS